MTYDLGLGPQRASKTLVGCGRREKLSRKALYSNLFGRLVPARHTPAAMTSRPAVHTETLLACVAVFIVLAGNGPFWHAALANRPWAEPATWLFAGAMSVSLSALYFALAAIFSSRHTVKPLATALLVGT